MSLDGIKDDGITLKNKIINKELINIPFCPIIIFKLSSKNSLFKKTMVLPQRGL